MNRIVVGVDIAKRVFQLHWVEPATGEIVAIQLRRARFLEHFANRQNCLIGMEACGGSQHWARSLQRLGHEVKLLPGQSVKPFVSGNKSDAADARAIWTAVQQPGIKAVAVKTEEQQAVLALHRMREQLVKFRTAQTNGLRGLLTEYGEAMPKGRAGICRDIAAVFSRLVDRLPAIVIDTLREQYARLDELDERIGDIEKRLRQWQREDAAARRVAAIPGVGQTPYRDGTTHGVFEPLDFLARLAALVPTPGVNLTRFHGVFAPHHGLRAAIVPGRKKQPAAHGAVQHGSSALSWAQRLKRVFAIDIERCEGCGGKVKIIACIQDPEVIEKILRHLEKPAPLGQALPRGPPAGTAGLFD